MSVELYVDKVGYLFCFLFFQHFKAVFHYLLFCMVSRENFLTFFGLLYAMCLFFLEQYEKENDVGSPPLMSYIPIDVW